MKKLFLFFLLFGISLSATAQVNYTANNQVTPYAGDFRPGVNFDYTPPWTPIDQANIAAGNPSLGLLGLGAKTTRVVSLSENFVENWGYDFEINNVQHFQGLGLDELTAIVGFPAEWHRDQSYYCSSSDPDHIYCANDPYTWD